MGQIDLSNLDVEALKAHARPNIVTDDAFKGVGQEPGLKIWRIEKFQVVPWPKEEYGKFYSGDSFIILNTWADEEDTLHWDIHFWLGAETTQDEAGTAAYKTVELDESLGGAPIQHREVEGCESRVFLSYFKSFIVQKGGIESGFNHVEPEEYRPRLLHVSGTFKSLSVREVSLARDSLNSGDVFVLDKGTAIIQFNGKTCGPFERTKANSLCEAMEAERAGKAKTEVYEESDAPAEFWDSVGGRGDIPAEAPKDVRLASQDKAIMKLSDSDGSLSFEKLEGVDKSLLDTNDVFVVDVGFEVFVWIGNSASRKEKSTAMTYAESYLKDQSRPPTLPITVVREGRQSKVLEQALV